MTCECIWTGRGVRDNFRDPDNWVNGRVPSDGDSIKIPESSASLGTKGEPVSLDNVVKNGMDDVEVVVQEVKPFGPVQETEVPFESPDKQDIFGHLPGS